MDRTEDTPHVPLIVVRIEAHTSDLDRFVRDYCRYFGADIVFLPTEGVQPPGRRVRFAFGLADGSDVICGEGVVLRMRRDSGNPQKPPGMELRYEVLDEASQQIVDRMLHLRTGQPQKPRPPEPPPYVSLKVESDSTERFVAAKSFTPFFVLPANPFAEVSDRALGFFVEEAFERITGPSPRWRRNASVFAVGLTAGVILMTLLPSRRVETMNRRLIPRAIIASAHSAERPTPAASSAPSPEPIIAEELPLEIHSSPPGARVTLDGKSRGHTPVTLQVSGGAHQLELERARYAPVRVDVRAPSRVVIPLERPPATLRVTSTPPGAEVRLRGHVMGTTPLELPAEGYETYALELAIPGHTRHRRVYLRPPIADVDIQF